MICIGSHYVKGTHCVCVYVCVCVCVEDLGVSLVTGNFLRHIDVGWCAELFYFFLYTFLHVLPFFSSWYHFYSKNIVEGGGTELKIKCSTYKC